MKAQAALYTNLLIVLYLAVAGILFCLGIIDVSFPEFLNRAHLSDTLIGLNGSLFCLGFVVGSMVGFYLLKKLSYLSIFRVCGAGIFILLLLLGFWQSPSLIFVLSFSEGILACCVYIVLDTSAASLSNHFKNKAFLNGIYLAVTYGAYAMGTSAVYYMHNLDTLDRFLLACLLGILLCLPLAFSKKFSEAFGSFQGEPSAGQPPAPSYMKAIGYLLFLPLVLVTVFLYGALDEILPELLPVYAENLGLTPGSASLVLTIFILGSAILPPLLGYIADRIGYTRAAWTYLVVFTICCLIMLLEMGDFFFTWPTLFIMGGITSGLSALGITLVGLRYKGAILALACMSMEFIGNISGTIMTLLSGKFMNLWGPSGLTISLFLLCFLGFCGYIFCQFIKPKSLES